MTGKADFSDEEWKAVEDGVARQPGRAGGDRRGLRGSGRVKPAVTIWPPAESKGAMTSTTSYQTVRL